MRKIITIILVICMMVTLFAGCAAGGGSTATDKQSTKSDSSTSSSTSSQSTKQDSTAADSGSQPTKQDSGSKEETKDQQPKSNVPDYLNATGYPIVNQRITLKAMVASNPTLQEMPFMESPTVKRMEEITNIVMEYEEVPIGVLDERKTSALMSGDLPDIMFVNLTPQEEALYGGDAFIDLTDLIDQYNPNLKKLFEQEPGVKGGITNTDGSIYAYPYIYKLQNNESAPFINKRWLDNLGLKVPETLDQFYNVMKAFKTMDPNGNQQTDEIPFGGPSFHEIVLSAVGIPGNYTQFSIPEDGTNRVVWSVAHPNAKEYVQLVRRMYAEGIVGDEIFNYPTTKMQEDLANDSVGALRTFLHIYIPVPSELTDDELVELSKEWEALPVLTSHVNSRKQWRAPKSLYTGKMAITKKCKYPEAAARWVDLLYLPYDQAIQGISGISMRYGIQGEHWVFEDDTHRAMISLPIDPNDPNSSTSSGLKTIGGIGQFPCYADVTAPYAGRGGIMKRRHIDEIERVIAPYWVQPFPTLRNTPEELEIINTYESEMKSYSNSMIFKFITGQEPLENWDAFMSTLKQMGLDEITAAYQAAYDRLLEAEASN